MKQRLAYPVVIALAAALGAGGCHHKKGGDSIDPHVVELTVIDSTTPSAGESGTAHVLDLTVINTTTPKD